MSLETNEIIHLSLDCRAHDIVPQFGCLKQWNGVFICEWYRVAVNVNYGKSKSWK